MKNLNGGLILSAGISSRMGRFKAMLPIGGTTFISMIIDKMRKAGVEKIVVVTGYNHEELEEYLKDSGVQCVYNELFYETQMLDSLKIGLRRLQDKCDQVIVMPVDAALSPAWLFKTILSEEGDFIRPVYRGQYGHPVLLRKPLFRQVMEYCGENGLKGAIENSGRQITDIDVDEEEVIMDADTPEDYRRAVLSVEKKTNEGGSLHPHIEIKICRGDILCGDGLIQLMELIHTCGSLKKAAAAMHISYSKAWTIIRYAEEKAEVQLVVKKVGGDAGGMSELTECGMELVKRYRIMRRETEAAVEKIFARCFADFRF